MRQICVNLFGGPCAGKSTVAYGISCLLKLHQISVEYISEFAKDCTWEGRQATLQNQYYIFGKQHHKLFRVQRQVSATVTDSPLLLSIAYGNPTHENFKNTILEAFSDFDNLNFFVEREHDYNENGRNQNEVQANELHTSIRSILDTYNIPYIPVVSGVYGINKITQMVAERILGQKVTLEFYIAQRESEL